MGHLFPINVPVVRFHEEGGGHYHKLDLFLVKNTV